MNRTHRYLIVAAVLLVGAGCAGYDDREAQSEFEKLRKYPITPQGDRILPDFEGGPTSEDAVRLTFRTQRPSPEKSLTKVPPAANSLIVTKLSIDSLVSHLCMSE